MGWQKDLGDILRSYFSYQSIKEGVQELVLVTEENLAYHQLWLTAIDSGIDALMKGNIEVFDIINSDFNVESFIDAKEFLEKLRDEYIKEYENAIES
ncbi:hypothetical protein [Anthocerotibacter panamensis]|uniref:hypothetical protein n=1 Tax=Anthocerotibacter panamensis TaxID=2857077 RepID=UPI001C40807E|nr:hypothetical protein [Anthocerotibacter panamensis]